ncbi:MAG TPA: type II secretion system F family protein [Rhizomicrobium sp.]|jgi:tight adherence protein B|nr:type II secretion system F family protein [Rhizomicrobium sp.]
MSPAIFDAILAMLVVGALGSFALAFAGGIGGKAQRRVAAVGKASPSVRGGRALADATASRRKNVTTLLLELEKQQKAKKQRPTLRRRLERSGLKITPQVYWIIGAGLAVAVAAVCFATGKPWYVAVLGAFGTGLGLPRWVIGYLTRRREKKFTEEFANAIDVIVRSVRSGLPTNEALKIVARESPDPVGTEFTTLVEGLKVGVTLEQGLKRMYDNMPTAEVSFFAIVMAVQQKSGGNLSEALSNLSGVLRDRKRLQGKIKAMSSEAKASAGIIGSLPIIVMVIVYLTTPSYIMLLFTERAGNLMLVGCGVWMSVGIGVMRKMINFKH